MNDHHEKRIKVLVVYYSQTGQLLDVANSFVAPLKNSNTIQVDYLEIKPVKPYPFPWTSKQFFEVFPESVMQIPIELQQNTLVETNYDLIILAYQPWYLSLSIPMNSFLQSDFARQLLKDKKVISLIGSRNMWTQAYDCFRQKIKSLGAHLVGNIALRDRAYNLVSVYTIMRWMFSGNKGNSGISKTDIKHTEIYGEYIRDCLLNDKAIEQKTLVSLGAVECVSHLILLESRAKVLFKKFAAFILKKGEQGNPNRNRRLTFFKICLMTGLLLSPITFILSKIQGLIMPRKLKKIKDDYEGV